MPGPDPVVEYASPCGARGPLGIARLAEASAFAGFLGLAVTAFGVAAVPIAWLAWLLAVAIVGASVTVPLWLARIASRRAAGLPRANHALRVSRSVARARQSAVILLIFGALTLWAFPNRLESFRDARAAAAEAAARRLPEGMPGLPRPRRP